VLPLSREHRERLRERFRAGGGREQG